MNQEPVSLGEAKCVFSVAAIQDGMRRLGVGKSGTIASRTDVELCTIDGALHFRAPKGNLEVILAKLRNKESSPPTIES